jgi:hypothetical protein
MADSADKAFMLVEFFAVISIIALFLAVIVPVLLMVGEQGRIFCVANLKNYDSNLPGYTQGNSNGTLSLWMDCGFLNSYHFLRRF